MMKGLIGYESAFRNYVRALIEDFVEDNIQYAETRPNFMTTNHVRTDDGSRAIDNEGIMNIIDEEIKAIVEKLKTEGKYFGGMKVIHTSPRSFSRDKIKIALDECVDLKLKYPHLICGMVIAPTSYNARADRNPRI